MEEDNGLPPTSINGAELPIQVIQPEMTVRGRSPIIYVLGGGGVRGLAHIGALQILEEAGIVPNRIVGCSAGAIVGALYAATRDLSYVEEVVVRIAPYSRSYRFFGLPSLYKGMQGAGLFSLKKFGSYLAKQLPVKYFEELKIPLTVVATNLNKGTLTTFSRGELIQPICASGAIPGLFQPVWYEGEYYVDGAVISIIPVEVAREEEQAGFVIAFDINNKLNVNITKLGSVLERSLLIANLHRTERSLAQADVVIDPLFIGKPHLLASPKLVNMLLEAGKKAARKALPIIRQKLASMALPT